MSLGWKKTWHVDVHNGRWVTMGARLLGGVALVGALVLGDAQALAQSAEMDGRRIFVSAEGRVSASPDMATITLGVQREASTAGEAVALMSEDAGAILAAIEAAGVAQRDVQTSGLSLSPRYSRPERQQDGPPKINGYYAETTVAVRVREISNVGAVLDSVVNQGANLFRGLSFGIAQPQSLQDEARRKAVAEAARQAALYAEAAGVTLGSLVRLEADSGSPRPEMMRSASIMSEDAGVPIAAGEVSLTARVRMTYEIADN